MTELLEKEKQNRADRNCTAFLKYLEAHNFDNVHTDSLIRALARVWSETK